RGAREPERERGARERGAEAGAAPQRYFELVDTGGIGIVDSDHLEAHVEEQIRFAIERADAILFLVDVNDGVTPLDQTVAELLRKAEKPVIPVVNKVDSPKHEAEVGQFVRLGHGQPVAVSALHGRGREELLERVLPLLPEGPAAEPAAPLMKLAIVGKRNAGKSTLVNALAGEPRMIVSEIPGTTRDAVDVRFERDGRAFIAIDTAGVRKKSSMSDIDFYSYTRALRSIRRADVVMLLIDALVPVAEVDVRLAGAILEEHKPVILAVNKWDLGETLARPEEFNRYLTGNFPAIDYAPIVFISAQTGRNLDAALQLALDLHAQTRIRVPTAQLNEALQQILALRGPSPKRGTKPVKVYYATQIAVAPPTVVMFCNDPGLVREDYKRFMEHRLRELTPFKEVPMRLLFRPRGAGRAGEPA
ncbi:MAG: ribosome biogenesis GTPase Der, partial [Planctomycetota bacterium]